MALVCFEETQAVIRCAFDVLNGIGHGYHEKPYENALVVEFEIQRIPYEQQPRFPLMYRGVKVADFIPDLVAYGRVIVDAKVIDRIGDHEVGQMLNYLKITGLPVGLILNFRHSRLEVRRVLAGSHPGGVAATH